MIYFVSFKFKVGSCKRGVPAGRGFYPVKPGYLLFRTLHYCLKKPHKTYIGDVRCDTGRVLDYTSYFVTVGLSNTVQLRWLENYSVMLELLESLLCCLARHLFFLILFSPDVIKTCHSTSVYPAL